MLYLVAFFLSQDAASKSTLTIQFGTMVHCIYIILLCITVSVEYVPIIYRTKWKQYANDLDCSEGP